MRPLRPVGDNNFRQQMDLEGAVCTRLPRCLIVYFCPATISSEKIQAGTESNQVRGGEGNRAG